MKYTHKNINILIPSLYFQDENNKKELLDFIIKHFTDLKDYKYCYYLKKYLSKNNININDLYIIRNDCCVAKRSIIEYMLSLNDLEKDYKEIFKKDIEDYNNLNHFYMRYSSLEKTIKNIEDF